MPQTTRSQCAVLSAPGGDEITEADKSKTQSQDLIGREIPSEPPPDLRQDQHVASANGSMATPAPSGFCPRPFCR